MDVWQAVLSVRSLVLPPEGDSETWVKFASLCRKSGRVRQAQRTLSRLMEAPLGVLERRRVQYSWLKHLWYTGQRDMAFKELAELRLDLVQARDKAWGCCAQARDKAWGAWSRSKHGGGAAGIELEGLSLLRQMCGALADARPRAVRAGSERRQGRGGRRWGARPADTRAVVAGPQRPDFHRRRGPQGESSRHLCSAMHRWLVPKWV